MAGESVCFFDLFFLYFGVHALIFKNIPKTVQTNTHFSQPYSKNDHSKKYNVEHNNVICWIWLGKVCVLLICFLIVFEYCGVQGCALQVPRLTCNGHFLNMVGKSVCLFGTVLE
jgi:hypothetical protein